MRMSQFPGTIISLSIPIDERAYERLFLRKSFENSVYGSEGWRFFLVALPLKKSVCEIGMSLNSRVNPKTSCALRRTTQCETEGDMGEFTFSLGVLDEHLPENKRQNFSWCLILPLFFK